jgi:hypothetical protein
MCVRGVVPEAWEVGRRAVELDPLTDEYEPFDCMLHRPELVRHVQDRDAELAV